MKAALATPLRSHSSVVTDWWCVAANDDLHKTAEIIPLQNTRPFLALVHMGGRVYDPYIGRFLSPDEYVQYPEFTQSYNRYSYVLNNPLSMVDPTGEESTDPVNNDDGSITYSKGTKYEWTQGADGNARLTGAGKKSRTPEPEAEGKNDLATQTEEGTRNSSSEYDDVDGIRKEFGPRAREALADAAKYGRDLLIKMGVETGIGMGSLRLVDRAVDEYRALNRVDDVAKNVKVPHGNKIDDRPATLYEKYDRDGNFLKHGITKHEDPTKRYTAKEINGGTVVRTDRGPRSEIIKKERDLVERSPGPDNHEPWAGKRLGE